MQPDEVIENYETKIAGATPESVLRDKASTLERISNIGSLQKLKGQIKLSYEFVQDCVSGRYVGYSKKSLMVLVGGLAYLALPIDIVPDFIPIVGWLDDVIVLGWVFSRVAVELERYRKGRKDIL